MPSIDAILEEDRNSTENMDVNEPKKRGTAKGKRAGNTRAAIKSIVNDKTLEKNMIKYKEGNQPSASKYTETSYEIKRSAAKGKRAASKPAAEPVTEEPNANKPAAKKQFAKKRVAEEPDVNKPAATKPATKKPAPKKRLAKKRVAEEPDVKEPDVKGPAAKKTAAKKAVKKKLLLDKTISEESMINSENRVEAEGLSISKIGAVGERTASTPYLDDQVSPEGEDEAEIEVDKFHKSVAPKRRRKGEEVIKPNEKMHTSKKAKSITNTDEEPADPPNARGRPQKKSLADNAQSRPQIARGRKRKESGTEESELGKKKVCTKNIMLKDQSILEQAKIQELRKRKRKNPNEGEPSGEEESLIRKRARVGTASAEGEDEYIDKGEEDEDLCDDAQENASDSDETASNISLKTVGWNLVPPPVVAAPLPPFSNGYRGPEEYVDYQKAEDAAANAEAEAKKRKAKGRGRRGTSVAPDRENTELSDVRDSIGDICAVMKESAVAEDSKQPVPRGPKYWSCNDPEYLGWLNGREHLPGPKDLLPQPPTLPSLREALQQQPRGWGPSAPTPEEFLGRNIPHPLAPPPEPKGNHSEDYLIGALVGAGFGHRHVPAKLTSDMILGYNHTRFRQLGLN